ncbi:TetR/AcrR family transcriptional regulator [Atopobium fossor]|uniref:TetR/AcrR family transcriptional regulator n=1 Tax=Atopobium fossor TaxID=39487 RepID=UPI000408689A|nr:TetR/AcrR family transcriptional regulator [Atopobium fossor]
MPRQHVANSASKTSLTNKGTASREHIIQTALQEFSTHGYEKSSMRAIAASAGLTTGAIYGYFPGKGELFDAIITPVANQLLSLYDAAQERFLDLPEEDRTLDTMYEMEQVFIEQLAQVMYDNRDALLLLLESPEGTSWQDFISELADIEDKAKVAYLNSRNKASHKAHSQEQSADTINVDELSPALSKVFAISYFNTLFTVFKFEPDFKKGLASMRVLVKFFHSGYEAVMP